MLTHLSLFSGIGGLDIAAEMAGFETVGQCEWADYPTKVLEKHWPDVPRWRDIRTLTGESFYERTGLRTVDVISGGFPCQPFSIAGQRRGTADDRYLWPEMLRAVQELRPTWVIGENVAGIISMVKSVSPVGVEGQSVNRFEDADHYEAILSRQEDMLLVSLIGDLERIGYEVQAFVIPACAVGAAHRRDRVALVAWNTERANESKERDVWGRENSKPIGDGENVANTESAGLSERQWERAEGQLGFERGCQVVSNTDDRRGTVRRDGELSATCGPAGQRRDIRDGTAANVTGERRPTQPILGRLADGVPAWMDGYWLTEPEIPRVATGVPGRVDQLKALGNAVYWRQFYPVFSGIFEIEMEAHHGEL